MENINDLQYIDDFRDGIISEIEKSIIPKSNDLFISANGLYIYASMMDNKMTIPFIAFPEINIESGLEEINHLCFDGEEISGIGQDIIAGITLMQTAKYCLMVNEASIFYSEKDKIAATVEMRIIDGIEKYFFTINSKASELLSVISVFDWMQNKLTNEEVVQKQEISGLLLTSKYGKQESFNFVLFEDGELKYNYVFIDNDGGVLKFDERDNTIEEKSGREYTIELMKLLNIGDEFSLNINQREGF